MCSTALWRNYIAHWKIENSQLYLIDVFKCGASDNSLLEEIFNQESPIKADWYSGKLFVQHGKQIRYQHSGFERYHEQETVIEIQNGIITSKEFFTNGYFNSESGFPCQPDSIRTKIHSMIKWSELPELSNDLKIDVQLITGPINSLRIIKIMAPELYIYELNRILIEFPQLKKIYVRNETLRERFVFPVVFSEENQKKYAR